LKRARFRSRCLALALGLLVSACGEAGSRVYSGRGVVREVQKQYAQVVIEHEDIVGLMPAMTMNFDVADPALLEQLEPGQSIDFELEFTGKSYRIVRARARAAGSAKPGETSLSGIAALLEPAPEFRLTDQHGATLTLSELRGKAVLLDFIYTQCPGPCPILTGSHVELYRLLAPEQLENVRFVSISLDPATDTPQKLQSYARARGADLSGWAFLTGPVEAVDAVIRSYGVGSVRKEDGTLDHLVVTFLIDPEGRIARRYMGLDHEPQGIARDLERILARDLEAHASPSRSSL
jgi:protein SCO1/2